MKLFFMLKLLKLSSPPTEGGTQPKSLKSHRVSLSYFRTDFAQDWTMISAVWRKRSDTSRWTGASFRRSRFLSEDQASQHQTLRLPFPFLSHSRKLESIRRQQQPICQLGTGTKTCRCSRGCHFSASFQAQQ